MDEKVKTPREKVEDFYIELQQGLKAHTIDPESIVIPRQIATMTMNEVVIPSLLRDDRSLRFNSREEFIEQTHFRIYQTVIICYAALSTTSGFMKGLALQYMPTDNSIMTVLLVMYMNREYSYEAAMVYSSWSKLMDDILLPEKEFKRYMLIESVTAAIEDYWRIALITSFLTMVSMYNIVIVLSRG